MDLRLVFILGECEMRFDESVEVPFSSSGSEAVFFKPIGVRMSLLNFLILVRHSEG